jgi:hypothetical protein
MFGIEADKHGSQNNHQEPSQTASNLQLPLEVFPHTHIAIVRASTLIRSLSHVGDVTSWRHVGIWLQRHEVATGRNVRQRKSLKQSSSF